MLSSIKLKSTIIFVSESQESNHDNKFMGRTGKILLKDTKYLSFTNKTK